MANTYLTTTYRMVGNAATTQNLFTISNASGSNITVTLRRLMLQMDTVTVMTYIMPQIKCTRTTVPTSGGYQQAKIAFDSATTSSTYVLCWGGAYIDGTLATAAISVTPTASLALWQQFGMHMYTLVGQILAVDCDMLPVLVADNALAPFKLAANEAITVHLVAGSTYQNIAGHNYFVNCVWEEA